MTADASGAGAPRFDVVLRGYDRRQVDEHVARLQRVMSRMRADLDLARSQPIPMVAPHQGGYPGQGQPPAGRPRPTPRPRPGAPGDSPDMIGSFTDRMQSILQAAEEEAAEIRNKARASARAESDSVRAELGDLIRQRDAVLAELTRLRGQLEGLLGAPTTRMAVPPREDTTAGGRPRETTAGGQPAPSPKPAPGPPRSAPQSPSPSAGGNRANVAASAPAQERPGAAPVPSGAPSPGPAANARPAPSPGGQAKPGQGQQNPPQQSPPAKSPASPQNGSARNGAPASPAPSGPAPSPASSESRSGQPGATPKPAARPESGSEASPAKGAAHRLPTGAYPAVEQSASMRPRTEPEPEPGDLFRPASATARKAEPETSTVRRGSAGEQPAGERTSVAPAAKARDTEKTGSGDVEATVKVGAVRPASAPSDPTVLTPAVKPASGAGAEKDKKDEKPDKAPTAKRTDNSDGADDAGRANRSTSTSRSG